jgi:hypothetical protein
MALPIPIDAAPDDHQLGREIILLSAQMNVANYHLLNGAVVARCAPVPIGWRATVA